MALLYNYCTYNGVRGGRYQSTAWDVCCPEWVERPEGFPVEWDCEDPDETVWVCFDGTNPQTWTCVGGFTAEWAETGVSPQVWEASIEEEIDWAGVGVNPQKWACEALPIENWLCGSTTNPVVWVEEASEVDWEAVQALPPAAWEPIVRNETAGKDCGD
jgi:hypothetical protein